MDTQEKTHAIVLCAVCCVLCVQSHQCFLFRVFFKSTMFGVLGVMTTFSFWFLIYLDLAFHRSLFDICIPLLSFPSSLGPPDSPTRQYLPSTPLVSPTHTHAHSRSQASSPSTQIAGVLADGRRTRDEREALRAKAIKARVVHGVLSCNQAWLQRKIQRIASKSPSEVRHTHRGVEK